MDYTELIKDIDHLINISRYFTYGSEKEYNEAIKKLRKLKKLIDNGRVDKFLKNGADDLDDS